MPRGEPRESTKAGWLGEGQPHPCWEGGWGRLSQMRRKIIIPVVITWGGVILDGRLVMVDAILRA